MITFVHINEDSFREGLFLYPPNKTGDTSNESPKIESICTSK
jgi:hypothetical protein